MDRRQQRTGFLVLAVVVGHLVLISTQVRAGSRGNALEQAAFGVFAEMQRALTLAWGTTAGVWSRYVDLRDLQARNDELAAEVDRLKLDLQVQRARANRAQGLRALLDMRRDIDLDGVSSRVIAASATPYLRSLTFDRGSAHGVYADAAVLAPDGVVGRVLGDPAPRAARVQLLSDRNAAAGARVERSRVSGVVRGTDDQDLLQMDYVSTTEDIRVGDRVVTSGADGIYPPGFAIGEVSDVRRGSGLLLEVSVLPAVKFFRLETAFIVAGPREPSAGEAGVE